MRGSTNAQRPPTDLSNVVNISQAQTVTGAKNMNAGLITKDTILSQYTNPSLGEDGFTMTFRAGQTHRSFHLFFILQADNSLALVARKTINGVDTYQTIFTV